MLTEFKKTLAFALFGVSPSSWLASWVDYSRRQQADWNLGSTDAGNKSG